MGRRRVARVKLPRGVQPVVNRWGRTYYYYAPGRGSKSPGKRVPLGSDTSDPEFWRRLREAKGSPVQAEGTLSALIAEFKKHKFVDDKRIGLRPASQRGYAHFLNRLDAEGGDRLVAAMTRHNIYALMDRMRSTPVAANYMLSVLRSLLEFGVKRGYRSDNPAIGVERVKVDESGHSPWPEAGYAFVMEHAPTHLRRMAFLGRACGQRVSDLVKMRPVDLAEDGINLRIGKLRDKAHMVPLTKAQMAEIRSWGVRDLAFFIATPATGKRCTDRYLNHLWNEWRASPEAAPIRDMKMTIDGLRATAINDRRLIGTEDGAIADELGMSVNMVHRYLRFADKIASARASRDRRERRMIEYANPRAI
jgi:integrase